MYKDKENNKKVNEPEYEPPEERPYYDTESEKEELEKVPVEYLAYLEKQREQRRERLVFWILLAVIVVGFSPGTRGKDYNPGTGEWRAHFTFGWGFFDYPDPVVHATEFTTWFRSKTPELREMNWVPYDKTYPALFGYLALPWAFKDYGWVMPENLVQRMQELDALFRPGHVVQIPRILDSVNNSTEWNAIVIPLTVGTARQAKSWWDDHDGRLAAWAAEPRGTALPQEFIDESRAYVEKTLAPDGNQIPLIPE